jgi:WD40 repeat protein
MKYLKVSLNRLSPNSVKHYLLSLFFMGLFAIASCGPKDSQSASKLTHVRKLGVEKGIAGFALSSDASLLAVAEQYSGLLTVWNTKKWKVKLVSKRIIGVERYPMAFINDGKYLLVPSDRPGENRSAALDIIDVSTGDAIGVLDGPNNSKVWVYANRPYLIALSEDGQRFYAGFRSERSYPILCAYDLSRFVVSNCWDMPKGLVSLIGGARDEFIVGNAAGEIEVWEANSKAVTFKFQASVNVISALSLNRTLGFLATGEGFPSSRWDEASQKMISLGAADAVRIWNWKSGVKISSIKTTAEVTGLAFSRDGKALVASFSEKDGHSSVHLYRVSNWEELSILNNLGEVIGLEAGEVGDLVAVAGTSSLDIYSVKTGPQ